MVDLKTKNSDGGQNPPDKICEEGRLSEAAQLQLAPVSKQSRWDLDLPRRRPGVPSGPQRGMLG